MTPDHSQTADQNGSRANRFDAVLADYLSQVDRGEEPDRRAFLAAHPDLADDLAGYFEVQDRMQRLARTDHGTHPTFGADGSPEHPLPRLDNDALPPGSLLGQYRLEEVIGEGAMGRIYRATHLHLDRVLAIKVLAPNLARDAQLVQRFHREARALAQLEHPHIVSIHDMGSQGDMHYFVMEYVPGVNLRQLLTSSDGRLDPERALQIVGQVCDALHFAHDRGIVHRDIKPENILIDKQGRPRVADFGLAKVLQEEAAPANLTGTNVVLGTYNYMSPEQKRSARVDHRADIYAAGVVLYELLTGDLPAGHFAPPSKTARVSAGVDQLVLKALNAEPEQRYQSAHDMGSDITTALGGREGGQPAPPPPSPGFQRARALKVVDSRSDQALGSMDAAWLRVILKDESLEIRTWPRPEIGIHTDGKLSKVKFSQLEARSSTWTGTSADDLPGMELKLPNEEATLHVPADLPLRVAGPEVEVTASSLRSALVLEPGTGTARVRDHRGPLDIERSESAAVNISGLQSDNFRVSTRKGRIVLGDLRFCSGQGSIHSDDGNIDIGVHEASCGFHFEARTLAGKISNELSDEPVAAGSSFLEGTVGRGDGRLEVDSFNGQIQLGDQAELTWIFDVRESFGKLGWAALWCGGAFVAGFDTLGWVLLWCWGIWAAWEAIGTIIEHKPWQHMETHSRGRSSSRHGKQPGQGPRPG